MEKYQEKVNEFTSWALIGDLFASMTEEDMFKTSNKNVVPFKLSTDKLNIGISYSHGTLDNTKESAHVLQIKSKRGVPQEWFVENLINALSDGDCVDDDLIKLLLDCHKKSMGRDGELDVDLFNTMMILSVYKELKIKL